MRRVYHPPAPRNDLPFVFLGAAGLTLLVFLVLPLTQIVSERRESLIPIRPTDLTQVEEEKPLDEPPPPPPEPEPPPQPPPSLADTPQPLDLNVSLEVVFGSGGALATGPGAFQDLAAESAALEAFSVADLEKRPELLAAVPPQYPEALRKAKIEGTVTLVFVLDETGRVEDPRVESSSQKEFEAPALEAVRKWKFKPGMKDGQAVRTYLRQPIRFRVPASG
ncbi:MAG: energy transducer TonB [Verrucomicrobiales bacterium]|nr:energy transducer TonB [Verrucomicrobiales bacterium]